MREGTSLVAQWLRICLPMQRTQGWSLVGEDSACSGASCITATEAHILNSPCSAAREVTTMKSLCTATKE